MGYQDFHNGLDIGAAYGTPIKAPADGKVEFVGYKAGYGTCIQINHGYGETLYGHCARAVSTGDVVSRGDTIGYVGNSGLSTGPHLHYEIPKTETPITHSTIYLIRD